MNKKELEEYLQKKERNKRILQNFFYFGLLAVIISIAVLVSMSI